MNTFKSESNFVGSDLCWGWLYLSRPFLSICFCRNLVGVIFLSYRVEGVLKGVFEASEVV